MDDIELPKELIEKGIFYLNSIKNEDFGTIIKCGQQQGDFIMSLFYKLSKDNEIEEIKDKEELRQIKNLYGIPENLKNGIIEG